MNKIACAVATLLFLAGSSRPAGGEKDVKKHDLAKYEATLLDLTNQERNKEGLKALRANDMLAKAARKHAENMAKQMKEEHNLDGKKPSDRAKAAGYRPARVGENVGSMTDDFTLEDLMKAWMNSKGHRANIVQKEYTEAGMGAAVGPNGRIYFAQVFGTPLKE